MEPLVLIGTVHLDPEGERLLLELLFELKPECVTVDVSEYALEYRRAAGRAHLDRLEHFRREDGSLPPGLEAVAAQLAVPFEYRAAERFAERSGARLAAVGDSLESQRLLGYLSRELMTTDNLVALAARDEPPLEELVAREWKRAQRHKLDGPPLTADQEHRLGRQDARTARRVRDCARIEPTAHVCGWEHLRGLCDELSDLTPVVRLLREG